MCARARNGQVWFDFHLVTEDDASQRSIDVDEDVQYRSDWDDPIM